MSTKKSDSESTILDKPHLEINQLVPNSSNPYEAVLNGVCDKRGSQIRVTGDILNPGLIDCSGRGSFSTTLQFSESRNQFNISTTQTAGNRKTLTDSYLYVINTTPQPADCGSLAHGGTENRTRYQSDSVVEPAQCVSEVQSRSCNDGTLSAWSPNNYSFSSCQVTPAPDPDPNPNPEPQPPADCGNLAHGDSETRTRYEAETVISPSTCVSETQTRSCNDGILSAWSPNNYSFDVCTVQSGGGGGGGTPPPPPDDTNGVLFTAVQSGDWFSSSTWDRGTVPGNGANVNIPMNSTVRYSGVSDARLYKVDVMGTLEFDPNTDSRMRVDTIWVHMSGNLKIGSKSQPVAGNRSVEIIFPSDRDINLTDYPLLRGRGIMAMGDVEMHGEKKTVHMKVAVDPRAGDTTLTMRQAPLNWKAGDTVVIAGTRYKGYTWDNSIRATRHYLPEDDVAQVTSVNGNTVTLDRPLTFDHLSPRSDLKTSVANYSRNIRLATEGGDTVPVHRRAHFMMMGDGNYDVRYAEFFEMGRTDKARLAFDTDQVAPSSATDNVKARYPLHFHHSNIGLVRNPGIVIGNAVFGSPGWGYVHHDSNAIFHNNASYNTHGAGFVAESGNEIGTWSRNIAIYAKGNNWGEPKNSVTSEEFANFDLGKSGDGFWFQGRMVEARHNIAASVNSGYAYFHRGSGMLNFDVNTFDYPEAMKGATSRGSDDAPILAFDHNEAFAANRGFHVTKANTRQGHDVQTHLTNFTAWSVVQGMQIAYTAHYFLKNIDLIGKPSQSFSNPRLGLSMGQNTVDLSVINIRIENFPTGIDMSKSSTWGQPLCEFHYSVVDAQFINVTTQLANYDPSCDIVTSSSALPNYNFSVNLTTPLYLEPIAGYGSTLHDGVIIQGTKTDGLGQVPFPIADDYNFFSYGGLNNIIRTEGYRTANGRHYVVLEMFFSDRLTGELHKMARAVEINPNTVSRFNQPWWDFPSVPDAGPIDLNSRPPQPMDDSASTTMDTPVTFNLVNNDFDPDLDSLRVDGIIQPTNGRVFDNGDGTVTYTPDFDFTGNDVFYYWVTDDHGQYTKASVSVDVQ